MWIFLADGVEADGDEAALARRGVLAPIPTIPVAMTVGLALVQGVDVAVVAAGLPTLAAGVESQRRQHGVRSVVIFKEVWRRKKGLSGVVEYVVQEHGVDCIILINSGGVENRARNVGTGDVEDREQV